MSHVFDDLNDEIAAFEMALAKFGRIRTEVYFTSEDGTHELAWRNDGAAWSLFVDGTLLRSASIALRIAAMPHVGKIIEEVRNLFTIREAQAREAIQTLHKLSSKIDGEKEKT